MLNVNNCPIDMFFICFLPHPNSFTVVYNFSESVVRAWLAKYHSNDAKTMNIIAMSNHKAHF